MNQELEQLFGRVCDGVADEAELAQLTDILRNNPQARDAYLQYTDLHSALADEALPGVQSNIIRYVPNAIAGHSFRFTVVCWGSILKLVAALAILLGLGYLLTKGPDPAPSSLTALKPTATLLFAEDCQWQGNSLVEGERLAIGVVNLQQGTAVLRMDGGAEVVLKGPAKLDLESPGSARLHFGEVVVRATDGAEGFTLHTPASEVVDLGTEFAVKVESSGATEVHVLDGEVACRKAGQEVQGDILEAGNAVRFESKDQSPKSVTLDAPRFEEVLRKIQPRERRDLMTVYEGFHYPEGNYAPSEIIKGKGWAGPWRLRNQDEISARKEKDSTTDMQIVHGKLNVAWPVPGGRLGMLETPVGKSFRVRPMKKPINLGQDSITYFSMMTHEPARLDQQPKHQGIRLTFRSSEDYWGQHLSFGISQKLRAHLNNGMGFWLKSAASVEDQQSLLWIGKINSRKVGKDVISFRLYGESDTLDYAEPAEWHVLSRGFEMDAKLDLVLLTSNGASPRIIDELRIGPTWRSVVPIRTLAQK